MCDKAALNAITKKICTSAQKVLGDKLEKVVLFGSYARGDYHEDSDIDVMILADIQPEDVDKTRDQIHDLTFYLDLEYNVVICLHIVCSAIFHKYLDTMPFFMNVRKDGVELYA